MTMRSTSTTRQLRSVKFKDLLLVSVFGFWTVLLGSSPLLAFRLLSAN